MERGAEEVRRQTVMNGWQRGAERSGKGANAKRERERLVTGVLLVVHNAFS